VHISCQSRFTGDFDTRKTANESACYRFVIGFLNFTRLDFRRYADKSAQFVGVGKRSFVTIRGCNEAHLSQCRENRKDPNNRVISASLALFALPLTTVTLLGALAMLGGWIAYSGGEVHHREFRMSRRRLSKSNEL